MAVRSRVALSLLPDLHLGPDCAVCIWDPQIVDTFKQPELTLPPDNFEQHNFKPLSDAKRVTALYRELRAVNAADVDAVLQRNLTVGIVDMSLGIYSRFHEYAIYRFGYDAEQSRRLAFMYVLIRFHFLLLTLQLCVACYAGSIPCLTLASRAMSSKGRSTAMTAGSSTNLCRSA